MLFMAGITQPSKSTMHVIVQTRGRSIAQHEDLDHQARAMRIFEAKEPPIVR